jgi:preprotein translocase subunit YajC
MIFAQESGDGGGALSSLLFFLVLLVGLYLLLIRPQRQRAKQLAAVRSNVAVGAQVITTAGLHARVVEVADDATVLLEIAPGVNARFLSQAIVRVVDEPSTEQADDDTTPPA